VGVGRGAPDLLTHRAAEVLRRADVLAAPRGADGARSLALSIARAAVGEVPGQELLLLTFPMTRDATQRRSALAAALEAIGGRLAAGKTVAFVAEGDPLVYGSFIDVLRAAPSRFPGVPVEVVPGVSSLTAAAAAARVPVADGDDRLLVAGARSVVADPEVLGKVEAAVILKAGPVLPELAAALGRRGLADRALLVSDATTPGERVVRGIGGEAAPRGYFSLVLVPPAGEGEGA
jgi:precorrin-2/cobalt-factor-2 C20-methyltransferase